MNQSTQPQTTSEALERYQAMLRDEQNTVAQCKSRWSSVGYLRGLLFLASVALLVGGFASWLGHINLWYVLSGVCFLAFLVVAFWHEKMQADMKTSALKARIYEESIAQINRDWPSIKLRTVGIPRPFVPTAVDLDLTGDNSLWKLIATTRTPLGDETLKNWIIDGALSEEVKLRQEAIAELVPEIDYRDEFRLRCETLTSGKSGPAGFVEWAESGSWLEKRQWLLWVGRATALTTIISLLLPLFGVPIMYAFLILSASFLLNFALSIVFAGAMHDIFNLISSRRNEVDYYVRLFDMIADFDAKSPRLKEIQNRLLKDSGDARQQIHGLGRRVWLANIRRSAFAFFIYLGFEFLFLWDVHVLERLEDWKKKHGHLAKSWFSDLGQWEALIALAKVSADHPEWVFPEVYAPKSKDDLQIECTQLGHPLIGPERVPNDVGVGPSGTVLLVSGSNMSGKSTLLRSIGVNAVLAGMGSVVCASSLRMPPVHIETSMRIIDSLSDGVSFFMAELKRLKEIVDTAGELGQDADRCLLFLLDEILQGTNSRERQIAVSRVVRRLIDQNAIGAISTHDLDLAKTDDLARACRPVHFTEQFTDIDGKREMSFDYQMKQGIAETTNALKLLEMVGLGEEPVRN